MSKKITLTVEQYNALMANAQAAPATPAKPTRALSFVSYASGEKAPANSATFAKALVSGDGAAAVYAHASIAKRAFSAASLREALSDPVVASAARAFLSALK
jgi:hypothetical protein